MTLGENRDKTAFSCNIQRPSGTTYLYMENFQVTIEGGNIEHFGQS